MGLLTCLLSEAGAVLKLQHRHLVERPLVQVVLRREEGGRVVVLLVRDTGNITASYKFPCSYLAAPRMRVQLPTTAPCPLKLVEALTWNPPTTDEWARRVRG